MPLLLGEPRKWARRRLTGLLLLVSCVHGESFEYTQTLDHTPFDPTPPVRLTRSLLEDQFPAWLPDGSGLVYNFIPDPPGPRDRCLGLMAPGGGQISATQCYFADLAGDSTDVNAEVAAWSGTQFAWMEQHNLAGRRVPDYGAIVVGSIGHGELPRRIAPLPYVSSAGHVHATILNLRWLSATQLAYIGADIIIRAPCDNCKPDTVVVAHEIMLLSTTGGPPVAVPNSDETTSIWPTADGTGLYFTRAGDTRVFRRSLAGGEAEIIFDFTGEGIVRDVSVVGNRLAATVGGNVTYGSEQLIPLRQIDSGGTIMTLDLTTGATEAHGILDHVFRRPVLSPDGRSVVAEGIDPDTSNMLSYNPDLWLFRLP